jgi:hypothetical protein
MRWKKGCLCWGMIHFEFVRLLYTKWLINSIYLLTAS